MIVLNQQAISGMVLASYLSDSNIQAWWKCDELIDGTDIVDYSGNGYDLTNGGMQEKSTNCLFGFGIRADGITDNCKVSLFASPNIQITQNLTIEGFIYPEDQAKVGAAVYWGCMDNAQSVGWQCYSQNGTMYWQIRTGDGLFTCSETHANIGFANNKIYHLRTVYDYTNSQIEIWVQNITDEGTLTKFANLSATGSVFYNTVTYDWFTLAGNNAGASNHFKGTFDQVSISDVIRTQNYYTAQNNIPNKDSDVNVGSREKRFDNVHATKVFADLFGGIADMAHTELNDMPSGSVADHDGRYYTETELDGGQLDNRYYTETEVDNLLADQDEFTELTDTPNSYAGQAAKSAVVNEAEDSIEFEYRAGIETVSRNIYVNSSTGSDSNDGSIGNPFLTLQHAVDSIEPIINNDVIVKIICTGTFEDDGSEEQSMAQVQKTCQGNGRISIEADAYEYRKSVTGVANNYVEITATRGDDFYNGCWVFVSSDNSSRGQLRQITDTQQIGGTLRLLVSPNWTINPSVGHLVNVVGRANCKQRAVAPPWRAFEVIGGDTYCIIYGFMFEDWNQGEAVPFYARQGCNAQVRDCAWTDCDTANGFCAFWDKGCQGYALECLVDGSVANTGRGFVVWNSSYCFMNRVQTVSKQYGIESAHNSRLFLFRLNSTGGTITGRAFNGGIIDLSTTYGTDGGTDGFLADVFGVISETGSISHTVRRELDLTTYSLLPWRTSAAVQPTPKVGELRIWRDSSVNKVYLIYNDTDEGVKKVELT